MGHRCLAHGAKKGGNMRKLAVVLVLALAASISYQAPAASASSGIADVLMDGIAEKAFSSGIHPDLVLDGPAQMRRDLPDGTVEVTTTTLREVIEGLEPLGSAEIVPGGSTSLNVGDVLHAYSHFCFPCDGAARYEASTSSLPETPPVVLPPPATEYFFVAPGPPRNIRASGYEAGLHTAGTVVGSNVDSAPGAPEPFPVWVPVATEGFLADSTLDFVGNALIAEAEFCLFGFCAAVGFFLGTGTTLFNSDLPVGFPTLP